MKLNKWKISPEYQRIPHLNKESNMTHDDICLEHDIEFPLKVWVQEKIDGANMGISWFDDAPIIRNREHILKKGYSKIKTPAKKQFTSAWNWVHSHEQDIKTIQKTWQSPITIYGEWMNYVHSIKYNKLPDYFIAYDIWSVEDNKFLAPDIVENLLLGTNISYIKPIEVQFNSLNDIITMSEKKSDYRDGIVEGIVLKTKTGDFLDSTWKIVNKHFQRRLDFNEKIEKNELQRKTRSL